MIIMGRCIFRTLVAVAVLLAGTAGSYAQELSDFTELVDDNYKAVVNISTSRKPRHNSSTSLGTDSPDLKNMPFGDFLRKFFDKHDDRRIPPDRDGAVSLGSGFVISTDGYVLTNNHVIDGADEILVHLHDRRQRVAELIGTDERSDIALLKIDAEDLSAVEIGRSNGIKVGEWVLAIGSPFGFDHSVTAGIVSAKGRALPSENYIPFIQTDVAINPGNSGGPLFSLNGQVIGINSQVYSRTGGFIGLSFAIPIELAMDVVAQLKDTGQVVRGWLGVIIQEVTSGLAESFNMDRAHGALVTQILTDGPAQNSTLQVGDVIVAFNGSPIEHSSSLPPLVGQTSVDDQVRIDVIRDGERETLYIKIGTLPNHVSTGGGDIRIVKSDRLNITVTRPSAEWRERMGIREGGAVVTEIDSGPAQRAGILLGDTIISIDNEQVQGPGHFDKLIRAMQPGLAIAVLVKRKQGSIFLAIKLSDEK